MEQHPVPQHIASYEFRLVGDMTLKQFGLLAANCGVAFIVYATGLPSFIKWPAIIFFVILGFAMAFVPLEERPLHTWFIAFIKAIYAPTQFIWQKKPPTLEIFAPIPVKAIEGPMVSKKITKQRELTEYLQTIPIEKSPLEAEEDTYVMKINNLFELTKIPGLATMPTSPPPAPAPAKKAPQPLKTVPIPPEPEEEKKPIKKEPEAKVVEAKPSPNLPFPQTPQTPNLLVGMVMDAQGKIVEGAIIEIRNSRDVPVRALKTNKLGQFRIVTPLKNDTYEIETEKEGFNFDIIKLVLKGEPVKPIEIRAKE